MINAIENKKDMVVLRFSEMLEEGKISQINKMSWTANLLPRLYIEGRKRGYWTNIVKLRDPVKLTGGCRIRVIKFGEIDSTDTEDSDQDIYDQALNNLGDDF